MKRILMAVAALSTIAAAGSAAAQPYRGDFGYGGGRDDARRLEFRIDRMAERGVLNRREARDLHAQVDAVERLQWRYSRDGLSPWEARDIDRRFDMIRARLSWERDDAPRYGYGYR